MSRFVRNDFSYHGTYLTYCGHFIARFKYQPRTRGRFTTFLIKNFTVEEYLGFLDMGETPLGALRLKGYAL